MNEFGELIAQAVSITPTASHEILVTDPTKGVAAKTSLAGARGQSQAVVDVVTGEWLYPYRYCLAAPLTTSEGGSITNTDGVVITGFTYAEQSWVGGLVTLEHTNIVGIHGTYIPTGLDQLTTLTFTKLKHVTGSISLQCMNNLTTINAPALEAVDGDFGFNNGEINGMIGFTVNAPLLKRVGGQYGGTSLPSLESCLQIFARTPETVINYPALKYTSQVNLFNCLNLTEANFPVWEYGGRHIYTGNLTLAGCPLLSAVDVSALKTIVDVYINGNCDALVTLSLPSIERIYGKIEITLGFEWDTGPVNFTTLTLGDGLLEVGGDVLVDDGALTEACVDHILVKLAGLNGTNGTVSYDNKSVTLTGGAAAPSATGLAAKATLEGRGCTVTHN